MPLSDAVIMAAPGPTAATAKVALDAPAWIVTAVCTVTTKVLLLNSETVAPSAGAAAVRLTVPVTEPPLATLDALSVTEESAPSPAVTVSVGD